MNLSVVENSYNIFTFAVFRILDHYQQRCLIKGGCHHGEYDMRFHFGVLF